jgi:porin
MYFGKRALVIGSVVLLASIPSVYGQESSPSPSPQSAAGAKVAATKPTPDPEDFWTRETMTGDWGGTRSRWKEKGIELEFKLSNFVQGIASGGTNDDTEYTGKFEMKWKFDLGKVANWKYWSSEIKAEVRFSGPLVTGTGGLNPVNTAAITPGSDGEVIAITAANFTRLIPIDLQKGDLYVVSFGRFNLLDLIDEDFFGGAGTEKFMNIAQIGPLTVLREVPLVTNGVNFAYVKGGEPRFTFSLLDPNDHTLDPGLDDLFADGVTFYPSLNFPTKYGGKSGKHSIGFAITTKKFTPFDQIRQIILPGPPRNPIEPKRGSWSASYTFRQYFVERGKRDGWGVFSQVAIANPDTSPITKFFDIGLGGNGLFKSRSRDEFGIAYAFTDLSNNLKDNLDLLTLANRRPQPEHQLEAFYNFHITPWLRLTGDLQIIRGVRPAVDTAVVPGARLVMVF